MVHIYMQTRYKQLLGLAALLILLAASCTGVRHVGLRPVVGPVPDATTEELQPRIALSSIIGLRSEVRADLYDADGDGLGSFTGALLMSPPRAMRLVLYDAFGARVMDISIVHGNAIAYVPSEAAVYEGYVPLPWPSGSDMLHKRDKDGRHRLLESESMDERGISREFAFNERLENDGIIVYDEGAPAFEAYFSDYASGVPMGMDFRVPGLYTFHLRLVEPEGGMSLAGELFDNLPKDASDIRLMPIPGRPE